jgi:hypothetical protein
MAALEAGFEPPSASETLDATMRHRERLLVGLRLRDGLELASAGLDPGAPILGSWPRLDSCAWRRAGSGSRPRLAGVGFHCPAVYLPA